MAPFGAPQEGEAVADVYRIRVRGHLDDRWSDWLAGLGVQRHDDGTTDLTGPVADQAALHGVLARIRDLGLPLLGMDCVAESPGGTPRDVREGGTGSGDGGEG